MRKLLSILAGSALLVSGCKPSSSSSSTPKTTTPPAAPVACFSINKALIDSGETVTTTNCSTHAATYSWNFGFGIDTSTSMAPSHTYSSFQRGKAYTIELVTYNSATPPVSSKKDTAVIVGYRMIDSLKIISMPVIAPYNYKPNGTDSIAVQFGSIPYTSIYKAPASWPCGFNVDDKNIFINSTNDNGWTFRVLDVTTNHFVYNIKQGMTNGGANGPIYLSRGLNVNPIVVTDGSGFEMDIYYHLSPTDK